MRWNAGFARGTDEGVRPYTCAWLRLRWTAEGGCPHIFFLPNHILLSQKDNGLHFREARLVINLLMV
ncbi:MAG: hypothetical protein DMG78_15335 [Acidobacteria bacterium]|nr:MAG: hypothetical protein DMG78_15335 [Acidobacteriota bacterium]